MARAVACALLGVILTAGSALGQSDGQIVVVMFDDLHLQFRETPRMREWAWRLLQARRPGDGWRIVTTGTSSVSVAPTTDSTALAAAIRRITGNALAPSDYVAARRGPRALAELRHRAAVTFATLTDVVADVSRLTNGAPFTVLLVSAGYDFRAVEFPADTVQKAVAAGATVHAFRPHLDDDTRRQFFGLDPGEWLEYLDSTRDSLRLVAEATGGEAALTVAEADDLLRRLGRR